MSTKDVKWLRMCVTGAEMFSTCAKRQYMAIILDVEGRVVGLGYNGGPAGYPHCRDGFCPRMQQGSASGSNYDNCIAIHAEENALLYSDRTARQGGTLIVNGPPCFGCTKKIVASGLKRVVYLDDPSYTQFVQSVEFFRANSIVLAKYDASEVSQTVTALL